jgi:hypothetical protein
VIEFLQAVGWIADAAHAVADLRRQRKEDKERKAAEAKAKKDQPKDKWPRRLGQSREGCPSPQHEIEDPMLQEHAYRIEAPVRKNGRDDYSGCSTGFLMDLLNRIVERGGANSWLYDSGQQRSVARVLRSRGVTV